MIKLNALETKIFQIFKIFIATKKMDLTLRVAGGWVRDKLLGMESNDIDIALDKCSGEGFAEMFHEYLKENDYEAHGFGVIRKNPEKSKHLETATIKIFDCWIDFVNLRGEEYSQDSRIPILTLGTPESDAFRRDFTINSLFYNINDDRVEDFTKMGLSDLSNNIIRTPLCPYKTFMDDPLRILRGFRFSVRFEFKLEPNILTAVQEASIKELFLKKVSRERVGIEFMANFEKSPCFKRSFGFFSLIHKSNYWPLILDTKNTEYIETGYRRMCLINERMLDLLKDFEYANQHMVFKDSLKEIKDWEFVQFTLLSVFTMDFYDKKIKDHKKSFVFNVIVQSLKMPNRFADLCYQIQRSYNQLFELFIHKDTGLADYAMWQRETGSLWRLLESLFNILENVNNLTVDKKLDLDSLFRKYGLTEFFKVKPLLDGKELGILFNISGIQIKAKQIEILRWQALNSSGTKEDFLKSQKLY